MCRTDLLITKAAPNNQNSNRAAATANAFEMGTLHFEAGGMKCNAPAAVELKADFSVPAHLPNFTLRMA